MTNTSDDWRADAQEFESSEWTLAAQAHYERDESHDLTTTIVFAIADAADVDPTALKEPTLYECVDVAGIEDTFFGPDVAGQNRDGVGTVGFRYDGYRVEVQSDGWIAVYDIA